MEGMSKNGERNDELKLTRVDPDDNELIGSLFKSKRSRCVKMINLARGKVVDNEEELMPKKSKGFGSMDVTLASFRKSLKGSNEKTQNSTRNKLSREDSLLDLNIVQGLRKRRNRRMKKVKFDARCHSTDVEDDVSDTLEALPSCSTYHEDHRDDNSQSSLTNKNHRVQTSDSGLNCSTKVIAVDEQRPSSSSSLNGVLRDTKVKNTSHGIAYLNSSGSTLELIDAVTRDKATIDDSHALTCTREDPIAIKQLQNHYLNSCHMEISSGSLVETVVNESGGRLCASTSEEDNVLEHVHMNRSPKNVSGSTFSSNLMIDEGGITDNELQQASIFALSNEACSDSDGTLISKEMLLVTAVKSGEVHDSGFGLQVNNQVHSLESHTHKKESFGSVSKCDSVLLENQLSDCADVLYQHCSIPEENGSCPCDAISAPHSGAKDSKLSAFQRAARKARKRRLGDMAYEGDSDWEINANEQHFLADDQTAESDQIFIAREKSDSSTISMESDHGRAAAVSAGLRAAVAGPIEKIKFKEFLKRKGGLQEYLECRNKILSIWSRNVCQILPLDDCGITCGDDSQRASLIREVYAFLDQSGYINAGISSKKDKAESDGCLKEETFESFSRLKHGGTIDLINPALKDSEMDAMSADPSSATSDWWSSVVRDDHTRHGVHHGNSQDMSEERRKIIVVGAGPSGLAAARHLKRQGFDVTVLEARDRIGGRVYTDCSSFSVPVDLGASIITGVEADVATERRPDPSALICAQLDLELTVLNSDCPLYDIVTGEKVPKDLDETLEAEYNSLLDDMLLFIAQKGEQSTRMSLEDGLEYALLNRRTANLGLTFGEAGIENEVGLVSSLERRVMDWHFANLEYGCAALLKEVSLPYWNQDDVYGGFGGAHCMIKGGYGNVAESLKEGLLIHMNHVVSSISYGKELAASPGSENAVKVSTSNGSEFMADAVLITVPLGCLKAETITFSPPLPQWKQISIQNLGFGVLNKIVMEFPAVFWDDSVDYFGATAVEKDQRGHCFMFWNVKKTVGAPVLIALLVGKAAVDGQGLGSSDNVEGALVVLRKLFGEAAVPHPVASVVTDWGRDPFSRGAYSYVAVGSSGEDYDVLGRPVDNCLFFAGEATCKEHPDTVGGAMMSGLREAVRIIDILRTGNDYTADVEAMEAAQRHSECERDEVRDITRRLDAVELSNILSKSSLDRAQILTRKILLQDLFFSTKFTQGRLCLAKELLNLPIESLKSFAGTQKGLTTLNSWILDSMGKDGTQLLRHCVRLLVLVSTDLRAVRLSGIGRTVKEKVCMHTSRDIRAVASQLVAVWLEVFRREKASSGGMKFSRQAQVVDSSKKKFPIGPALLKPSRCTTSKDVLENNTKLGTEKNTKLPCNPLQLLHVANSEVEADSNAAASEEERIAFAAAEAARTAAEAFASAEAKYNSLVQLPKIPSFHKFARREQYSQAEEQHHHLRRKWSGGVLGRQDCTSEIDSRNCRVRDWSLDFSAARTTLDSSRASVDGSSQRSHSNEMACTANLREQSGESGAPADAILFTQAWIRTGGSVGMRDYDAVARWHSCASDSTPNPPPCSMPPAQKRHPPPPPPPPPPPANQGSVSQVTVSNEAPKKNPRGADYIKQAIVSFVASLLMPVYKARKIDRDGYKFIMKKSATKVMEQTTNAEKIMAVSEFLDFRRKNKIRSFVDRLIELHMETKPDVKSG